MTDDNRLLAQDAKRSSARREWVAHVLCCHPIADSPGQDVTPEIIAHISQAYRQALTKFLGLRAMSTLSHQPGDALSA